MGLMILFAVRQVSAVELIRSIQFLLHSWVSQLFWASPASKWFDHYLIKSIYCCISLKVCFLFLFWMSASLMHLQMRLLSNWNGLYEIEGVKLWFIFRKHNENKWIMIIVMQFCCSNKSVMFKREIYYIKEGLFSLREWWQGRRVTCQAS